MHVDLKPWGVFSAVASHLAVRTNAPKEKALATLYGRLSFILEWGAIF